MSETRHIRHRLIALISVCAAALLSASTAPTGSPDVSPDALAVLDPTAQMRQLCGGAGAGGESLRTRLKAAMAFARTAQAREPKSDAPEAPPVLLPGLASVHYPITTFNPEAQRYFDQGLALTYGFNHAEAIRYFREAQRLDPACAMCWWGEAFAHGPNINAPMDPAVNARAVTAARQANALVGPAQPAEQALIRAIAVRYAPDTPPEQRAALDQAFATQMLAAASQFPQDDTLAVLAAESVMDTQPWDYWQADKRTPKGRMGEAIALIETVLARNPEHPQADHLYIHLMEASDHAQKAERYADILAGRPIPAAGHMIHMPGHLYYRVGRYGDAMRVNVDAAATDETFLKTSSESGIYRFGYYPHNVHFLVTSAQMAGDMNTAVSQARKLSAILNTDVSAAMPWVQPVNAAPYLAYAQFAKPADILALEAPDARLPYVTGMWHYARAVAYAQNRNREGVAQEIAAIRRIRETTDFKPMIDQLVPAPDLLRLAEITAEARLATALGEKQQAVSLYRQAAAIEDTIRYMEPPFWYYPVRQSLGAALYTAGDYDGARQAFLEALAQAPNNGWALYGLMTTQHAMGDTQGAKATEAAFERAWMGDPRWLTMQRL
ncbi:MAG TPA: tetratricopeptide repeat protein [Pedomonas sp.]|uniref:tetratricopeptide repeat protein n=1 Tax=Pedomonas sp. TaxID=2976421 RepID=UPI002F3E5212